jgi:hypothetical protein
MQSNNDDNIDNAAMQTEYNAAIQDVLEKIEARKHNAYEIRDPYGILRFLDTLELDASGSVMMRSRL